MLHRLPPALLLAAFILLPSIASAAEPLPFYLRAGDRVLFYGDSITEQRLYTTFVETFVLTRFPTLPVTFINSGWGGDRVTGGVGGPIATRLERDVFAHDPTVLTIMLGMNDGRYRPFEDDLFLAYTQGYLSILETIAQRLPDARITLIAPSPYDDVTRPQNFPGGYNAVLRRFGDFIQESATRRRLTFVNFNDPVVAMLQKAHATDPALSVQIIADRVHPGPGAHLIMASALLRAWNAPGTISTVDLETTAPQRVGQERTTVSDLAIGREITWTQLDQSLPFPLDLADAPFALAVRSSDFITTFNRQILRVSGLTDPSYRLTIDDTEVGVFTAAQLAEGINLATLPTPMLRQAARVAELTHSRSEESFWRWQQIQLRLFDAPGRNPALAPIRSAVLQALEADEARIVTQQRAAAQPVPRRYRLSPAQ